MVRHERDVKAVEMAMAGATGVTKRIMIGPEDGYDGFLRVFTIEPGGSSPHHAHEWFHANYILEGRGSLIIDGEERTIEAGSVAYIAGGKRHTFVNKGSVPLKFICLVPREGDAY
ncbi:MAG TPA: cupin domain-containing protein [Rectinemataceae bacterium]|nr:cupin domain-containing protein [Rectinemataceae bacterium]